MSHGVKIKNSFKQQNNFQAICILPQKYQYKNFNVRKTIFNKLLGEKYFNHFKNRDKDQNLTELLNYEALSHTRLRCFVQNHMAITIEYLCPKLLIQKFFFLHRDPHFHAIKGGF